MTRRNLGAAWAGLALIALGITLAVANLLGWDSIWPIFPLLGGLAFLGGYVASGFKETGFVFVGTGAALVGLFFFGFSLGVWEWGEMAQLWPVFPLIGGLAFLALFAAERGRDIGTLGVAVVGVIVGVVGLAFTYGFVGEEIVKFWPLLIVLVGLLSLVGGLSRLARRQ